MAGTDTVDIGIIGGVGQQLELESAVDTVVATPYGPTSAPVSVGLLAGRRVAFLNRRGIANVIQSHLVAYRANVWALASMGVRTVITTTAAGGLRDTFAPGMFVVPDQLIDRTQGRDITFYDEGPAVQLSAPDPFDPMLRGLAAEALAAQQVRYRDFGTAVIVNGPRFSTRAESRAHAMAGGDLITTTLTPETPLALELGMAVVNVSFLTDSDAGTGGEYAAPADMRIVERRIAQARPVLVRMVTEIARTVPAGYRATTGVPAEAIAGVLARVPR